MRLFRTVAALGLIAALAAPVGAAGNKYNHITHGPILGRISSHGVGIWARTLRTGHFVVRYGTAPGLLDKLRWWMGTDGPTPTPSRRP